MGHYDSCRLEETECEKSKTKKHKWKSIGYGVDKCKHCKKVRYTT